MNKCTIRMLQSFNRRLDSVSSLGCFDAPAVFPTRRVNSEKAIKQKPAGRQKGRVCKHLFTHVNPSTTRPTSRKTGSRVKMTNDKIHQNVPSRRVLHTRFTLALLFLCLCVRETRRLETLKLNDATVTRTSLKSEFGFFHSSSRLFLPTYFVKRRQTLLILIPRDHIQVQKDK